MERSIDTLVSGA